MNKDIKTYRDLSFREKLFMKLYCHKPPGKEVSADMSIKGNIREHPLISFERTYGSDFLEEIKDKDVLDVGCGTGEQVVGSVLNGAARATGVDIRNIQGGSQEWVNELGLSDRIAFTTAPVRELGAASFDVAYCLNSFEHFARPDRILEDIHYVLRRNGKLFISFGPPWLAPFGCHMYFMIKYPWANVLFSERTILNVRKLYRNDNANKFEEVEGGLNKMTYRRFRDYINMSNYNIESVDLTPVKGIRFLTKTSFLREFFITKISAVLVKR